MSDNGDNYENSDIEDNFSDDDSFFDDDEENILFTEGVDNSNNIKDEDEDDDKKSDVSEEEIEEVIEIIKPTKKKKFVSGINKIYPSEITKLLSKLAKSIEDSALTVPKEHHEFIVGNKTCSIEIARKWFDNRHIAGLELPQYIYRTSYGFSTEIKNPSKMKTDCELSFNGLIEEDVYFHQGFRKEGYIKDWEESED